MKLHLNYCTREQAEKLKALGVLNKCTFTGEPDADKEVFEYPAVGTFYSCITHEKEFFSMLGDQEDAPYKMYNPIKLYSDTELSFMLKHLKIDDDGVYYCIFDYNPVSDEFGIDLMKKLKSEFDDRKVINTFYDSVPAVSKADAVIYCLEQKLLNLDEINAMLSDPPFEKPKKIVDPGEEALKNWNMLDEKNPIP